MLVLSRKPGEVILIEGNIKVTVVSVRGDIVKLGIDAPKEINIVRPDAKNQEPSR